MCKLIYSTYVMGMKRDECVSTCQVIQVKNKGIIFAIFVSHVIVRNPQSNGHVYEKTGIDNGDFRAMVIAFPAKGEREKRIR